VFKQFKKVKGDKCLHSRDAIRLSAYLLSMGMNLAHGRMSAGKGDCCFIDPQARGEEDIVSHILSWTQFIITATVRNG
jgi:hypothetical protein